MFSNINGIVTFAFTILGQDSVTDQASEMESGYAASCIFFPILKDDADFRVTSTQPSTSLDCPECNFANWLQRVDVTDAKLLLVFLTGAEPDDQDSTDGDPMEDQEELVMNWIQHHPVWEIIRINQLLNSLLYSSLYTFYIDLPYRGGGGGGAQIRCVVS